MFRFFAFSWKLLNFASFRSRLFFCYCDWKNFFSFFSKKWFLFCSRFRDFKCPCRTGPHPPWWTLKENKNPVHQEEDLIGLVSKCTIARRGPTLFRVETCCCDIGPEGPLVILLDQKGTFFLRHNFEFVKTMGVRKEG